MCRTKASHRSRRASTPKIPKPTTEVITSPHRLATDSPSRQLQWELQQLAISAQECFKAQLDLENEQREALHRQALTEASARHNKVRLEAEQARAQLEQQIIAEKRRREEEALKEKASLRREEEQRIAADRKNEEERAKTAELEARRLAEARKVEKEAAEKKNVEKERRVAEIAQRVKDEQATQARRREETEAAEAAAKQVSIPFQRGRSLPAATSAQQASQAARVPQSAHRNLQWEQEHQRYLEIHQRLKELRRGMAVQAKQNPELKQAMGDMRRDIKKSVGQVREGKGANTKQLKKIMDVLKQAATLSEPSVDITSYLASPPQQVRDPKGPALLVYLLNIFAKAIIAQFVDEAGVKPQIADPIGTVASHIFAISDLRWNDISLIDILITKFHVVCPVLFGIYGDETSVQGKQRLGWWKEEEGGPFVPQQRHFERMTGLGAGFAGISLKNYEKARAKNPYPDHHYWKALARIANIPADQITQTHFVVLKGMIEGYEAKLLQFFGNAAMATLRHVLIELPKRSPPSVAAKALAGLVDVLKREKKLLL